MWNIDFIITGSCKKKRCKSTRIDIRIWIKLRWPSFGETYGIRVRTDEGHITSNLKIRVKKRKYPVD